MRLARDFGYAEEELTNAGHPYWGLYREAHRIYNADFVKMLKKPVRRVLRRREGGLSKKRGS